MPAGDQTSHCFLLDGLREILDPDGLHTDEASRLVYARDASHLTLGRPVAVALPRDADQLRNVLKLCHSLDVPVVCRGTGTGLSGGAVPGDDALVLGTSRLTGLGQVDAAACRVSVQPGVLNDVVSRHASAFGLHFAPDPSSQSAASIGGNIAENAGGPHCLRHGVTLQHLLHLDWSDAAGRPLRTGRGLAAERGLDLVSLLCGSEGTLGLVTAADLRLVADPPGVATLLAFFPALGDAARAVVGLLGDGLAPVAIEMVDQAMLLAVEEAFGFGFPTDVEAAMILEFAGQEEETAEDSGRAGELLASHGAREVRRAANEAERAELWKCRKKAFGAVGRLAPRYVTMDVVVPLGELPGLVRRIQSIKAEHEVEIATTFHAGDGNLHPGVHYDDRDPDQTRRAHAAADAIIREALDRGGSVTGEHGVGIEKLHVLPWQLDAETDRLQRGIKAAFDPGNLLNPGKLHPSPEAEFAPTKRAPEDIDFQWDSLTVSAPAEATLADIQGAALERGFWIPVGIPGGYDSTPAGGLGLGRSGTVGDLLADLLTGPTLCPGGTARDFLLELWAETGDGRAFHAGAPVFKNVAGYDLVHMLCGSGGIYVRNRAATFQLRPVPECVGCWRISLPRTEDPTSAFSRLMEYLALRDSGLGGPVAVIDAGDGVSGAVMTAIVPGRRRAWDLGRVQVDLAGLIPGVAPDRHLELPFARADELLAGDLMPAWALESPDWNLWTRERGATSGSLHWPGGIARGIWQSAPRLVWSPDALEDRPGWHTDPFAAVGRVIPPGPPSAGVPLGFLRRLKSLFDPEGTLETPPWMEGVDD